MRPGRARLAAVAVALGLAAAACSAGGDAGTRAARTAGASGDRIARTDEGVEDWIARTDDDAQFTVDCPFSHRAPDDPIVAPGRPGASHSHDFFGSTVTGAASTGRSLRGRPTTCQDPEDTAAYWVPTLSVAGVPVDPLYVRAYYRAPVGADVRTVTAPPPGLALIAGDPGAGHAPGAEPGGAPGPHGGADHTGHTDHTGPDHTGHPGAAAPGPGDGAGDGSGSPPAVGWGCGLRPRRLVPVPPDNCTAPSPLTLQLRFPDCWDGVRLDSPDHRAHVARSTAGRCPPGHPVLMTEVQLSVVWPVTGPAGAAVTLASGPVAGAHGDFLNGWEPGALARHVVLCIHAKANCAIG